MIASDNSNTSLARTVMDLLVRRRSTIGPLVDLFAWVVSLTLANILRFDLDARRSVTSDLVIVIGIALCVQLVVGWLPLYRIRWKVGSFEEIAVLSATLAITTGAVLLSSILYFRRYVPVGTVVVAGSFTLIVAAGTRSLWRLIREYQKIATDAKRTIIFGAGDGGRQVVDALLGAPTSPMFPVALLDDHPAKRNAQLRHLRVVGGREAIADCARRFHASNLVIAIPSADAQLIRDISVVATDAGLEVFVLPPVAELFAASLAPQDIRPLTDIDLLGRRVIDTNVEMISRYLADQRVLVTGAGGSIGSELCRQIHRFGPSSLIMLDRDESGLQQVQLSIEGSALLDSRRLVVCDIRDQDALRAVFKEHRPNVVFHAAALKHLPLLEMWPSEGFKTNVLGTLNLLDLSTEFEVVKFVNISTDKAADPISVLGYTKRIAERLTSTIGNQAEADYISVRFGNVLGSRGSFLSTFRRQIDIGGPVTVTDPDVTRYFMTVHEAVQLTIQAGAIGLSGCVLILDMGEPVRITDVARKLIAESKREIAISFTGLRPGEKLHEQLFTSGDGASRDVHPLIASARVPGLPLADVRNFDPNTSVNVIEDLRSLSAAVHVE